MKDPLAIVQRNKGFFGSKGNVVWMWHFIHGNVNEILIRNFIFRKFLRFFNWILRSFRENMNKTKNFVFVLTKSFAEIYKRE